MFQGRAEGQGSLRGLNSNMKRAFYHKSKNRLELSKLNSNLFPPPPQFVISFLLLQNPFSYGQEEKEDYFIQSLKKKKKNPLVIDEPEENGASSWRLGKRERGLQVSQRHTKSSRQVLDHTGLPLYRPAGGSGWRSGSGPPSSCAAAKGSCFSVEWRWFM